MPNKPAKKREKDFHFVGNFFPLWEKFFHSPEGAFKEHYISGFSFLLDKIAINLLVIVKENQKEVFMAEQNNSKQEDALIQLEVFKEYIRRKGLRYTPERETIIKEIFSLSGHFDVDGLYLRLRNKGKKLSKASIYRTIPLLIDCGLLQEVYHEDGHMHYEPASPHPHGHIRCLECRRVEEFDDERIKQIQKNVTEKYGYRITGIRFEILGYCPDCLKKVPV